MIDPADFIDRSIIGTLIAEGHPMTAGLIAMRFDAQNRPSRQSVAAHLRSLRSRGLVTYEDSRRWKGGKWTVTDDGRDAFAGLSEER